MDIVLYRLTGNFIGCTEKRAQIYVKAQVSKGRCDDFGAAIVPILTHFGHENTRPAARLIRKGVA